VAGALVLTGDPRALRAGGAGTALVYDWAVCVGQAIVLTALVVSPVSYVAPAREIGILIGAILGARVLVEGHALRRVSARPAMVVGVLALAVG
jgi:hypothetical protein